MGVHQGLAAGAGPLAHAPAGRDGLRLEGDGADGRVHGAQEEEQDVGTAMVQQHVELLEGQERVLLRAGGRGGKIEAGDECWM